MQATEHKAGVIRRGDMYRRFDKNNFDSHSVVMPSALPETHICDANLVKCYSL